MDSLITAFVSNGVEVVDRQHLETILAEHDLSLSGYVDQASAAAIGRVLGPSVLIFVKAQRCTAQQDHSQDTEERYDRKTKRKYAVRAYYSRTRAFLTASIQSVDLATGRIFSARTLSYSPELRNKSYDGYPEAPATFDVLDMAIRSAVTDAYRMFMPWSESVSLVFYNNKDCGLIDAFQSLKVGDYDGAFRRSLENLENCKRDAKVKEKILSHAYYNVGIGYLIREEHDEALGYFQAASRYRSGEIVTKAIADAKRARDLLSAMRQIEERAAIAADQQELEIEEASRAEEAATMTNADVVLLVESNLSDAIIIGKIKSSSCAFDTSAEALVDLTKAGVSDSVIVAMMEP